MEDSANTLLPIVSNVLCSAAQDVIQRTRCQTSHAYLLDAKLGNATTGPIPDTAIATAHQTPPSSLGYWLTHITKVLKEADQQLDNPLKQIALRTNDIMSRAAMINRHNRRPPLYSEKTIDVLIKLGLATPQHAPLIRAAGYVNPPPVVPLSHNVDDIIADIAAHMAWTRTPQSIDDIFESLRHRHDDLSNWPELDLALYIRRVADLLPDEQGLYHPDQPWGTLIRPPHLVANTVLHILARDQQPRTTKYLVGEVERLVGHALPTGYHILNSFNNFVYKSDLISLQGRSTFGLRAWGHHQETHRTARAQGSTKDHIYAFLMEQGPADAETVIEHVQGATNVQRRTVQDAINHDLGERFIRLSGERMAANPVPKANNPDAPALKAVPDGHSQPPTPVVRESELLWMTHYIKALNELEPPLPSKAVLTGSRGAGSTQSEPLEITVVVQDEHRNCLQPKLKQIASTASDSVPSVQPSIGVLSPQQWDHQQANEPPEAHYNVWLAPDAAP